jgi:hypothetical protein
LIFRNFGQKLQKHREHQKKQTTLKNTSQWTSKSGWDRDFFKTNVVLFLCCFFGLCLVKVARTNSCVVCDQKKMRCLN